MNSLRETALELARRELHEGAREIGGNNRGPYVRKYLAPAGLDEGQPWCASFVCWCYLQAAKNRGEPMPFAFCPSARRLFNALKRRSWETTSPLPGDLIFWTRGRPGSALGHVGFIEYAHDGLIQTIEGNRTARVERFKYTLEEMPRLLGFIRVMD